MVIGAVTLVVMGESLGLPVPGEMLLLLGTASAGAGYLEVWGVIGAAAGGTIVGDSRGRGPRCRRCRERASKANDVVEDHADCPRLGLRRTLADVECFRRSHVMQSVRLTVCVFGVYISRDVALGFQNVY
jgi:hypothetical protein